ncbi:MAG: ABC transporter permease [Vicinamibacterales bacterium]
MDQVLRDLRQGVRQLARRPAFAAAAIASLALGIGLNTTLFSVVNAVLLRDTTVREPERLVEIYSGVTDFPTLTTSYPDFLDLRAGAPALEGLSASSFVRGILSTTGRPELVAGEAVTANYFDLLGVAPELGRPFATGEDRPGAEAAVVISHGLWQRQFGAGGDVLGRTLELSGLPYTVIGVAPAGFAGTIPGIQPDFWVPISQVDRLSFSGIQANAGNETASSRLDRRGSRWLFVKGRLAPGRTVEEARTEVDTIFKRLAAEYPDTNEDIFGTVMAASNVRFHPMVDGYVKAASAVLLTAVGLVLLIACGNVANMLLARGQARRRELAIRAAVGAGRGRLVRQLLTEGLVLSAVGGGAGVLLAWWAGRTLTGLRFDALPVQLQFDYTLDGTVLAFAVGVSVVTAVLFGLAPALHASSPELVPALKESTAGDDGRLKRFTMRDALVVGQLALSLVLLVAGALLARGFFTARAADLGFDPEPIVALSFNLQMNGYDTDRAVAFRDRAVEALRAQPGVVSVTTATRLPMAPDVNMEGILVPGHDQPGDDPTPVDEVAIGPDYFTTVGVPLVAGRAITADEVERGARVAVVNEALAKRYWPGGSALGQRIYLNGFDREPHEVVGVSRDHVVRVVGEDARPYLQVPASPSQGVPLVVRLAEGRPAEAAIPALQSAIWALEPDIVFTEANTASEVASATMAPTEIGAMLLGAFGALALLLAAVGLYGVIAYSVSLRTREVGLRMALGAERGTVLRLVLGQGARLALVGISLGLLASAGVGKVLGSLLYGVSAFDPVAYLMAAGLLLAVAIAANLVPAIQASRIDPMRALRAE